MKGNHELVPEASIGVRDESDYIMSSRARPTCTFLIIDFLSIIHVNLGITQIVEIQ